jgi:hypothetical protein
MAKQSPRPPAARLNGWGATGQLDGSRRRFLTIAHLRGMRLQLSDLDAKLRQMAWAEHERRRYSAAFWTRPENLVAGIRLSDGVVL